MQKEILMSNTNEKIIRQKENLAAQALLVAEESLDLLKNQLEGCSTRDLIGVFNSAVKAHREIVSDIISLSDTETKDEKKLGKSYEVQFESLLKKINPGSSDTK